MKRALVPHVLTLNQIKKSNEGDDADLNVIRLGVELGERIQSIMPQVLKLVGIPDERTDIKEEIDHELTILLLKEAINRVSTFKNTEHRDPAEQLFAALRRAHAHAKKLPISARFEIADELRLLCDWSQEYARLARDSKGRKKSADHKRRASETAFDLLSRYSERPRSSAKTSPLRQLAELLAGDDRGGIDHHCRAVLARAERHSESPRVSRSD